MNDSTLLDESRAKPKFLTLVCHYCDHKEEMPWNGYYNPRYLDCGLCGRKYYYEPLAAGVSINNAEEIACCDDPDCREYDSLGHCEQ